MKEPEAFYLPERFFVRGVNGDNSNQKFIFFYLIMDQVRKLFNGSTTNIIITDRGKERITFDCIKR